MKYRAEVGRLERCVAFKDNICRRASTSPVLLVPKHHVFRHFTKDKPPPLSRSLPSLCNTCVLLTFKLSTAPDDLYHNFIIFI